MILRKKIVIQFNSKMWGPRKKYVICACCQKTKCIATFSSTRIVVLRDCFLFLKCFLNTSFSGKRQWSLMTNLLYGTPSTASWILARSTFKFWIGSLVRSPRPRCRTGLWRWPQPWSLGMNLKKLKKARSLERTQQKC